MEKSKRTCYEWTGETIFSRFIREQKFSQPGSARSRTSCVSKTLYLQKIRSTSRRRCANPISSGNPEARRPVPVGAVRWNVIAGGVRRSQKKSIQHTLTHSHTNRDEALRQNVSLKINAFEREDFLFFSLFRRPPFNPPGDHTLAALTRGGAAPVSLTGAPLAHRHIDNFNISSRTSSAQRSQQTQKNEQQPPPTKMAINEIYSH